MRYEISALPNGVRAVAAPLKQRNSIAVGVWVHVGGRDETPRLGGISHFLEHLVFKGTRTRTADQIKETVEGVGGSLNAFTAEECTCFFAKAAEKHFEEVLDVLCDIVLNPSLKDSDITKERTVIMEEIKMTQDQPAHLVEELLAEISWPSHALGRPLAGTLESVGAMSREEIRDYKESTYRPNFITVAASGAIDQKRLVKSVAARFASAKNGGHKEYALFRDRQTSPRFKLFFKKTEQTHLAFTMHTFPKDHPDEYALEILSIILGGNMSSRLFNEVREKRGLAYDVGSFVRKFHETGAFGVEAGVDNRKVKDAMGVILKELEKIARRPVSPGELKRAKEFYLGQLDLGLENSMNHMLWVGENAVSLGRCKTPAEVTQKVRTVTAGDLRRVARSVFRQNSFNFALVGPQSGRLEKELRRLLSFS
ncbi:MAG: M16 family metallopeptidase [Candidatus Omnitrophota bacterium]